MFTLVRTVLYIAIAIGGWLAWQSSRQANLLLAFWLSQPVLNAMWSWLFFELHRPGLALLDILLLLFAISVFIVTATETSAAAAILFVPYWLSIAIAKVLNFAIWRLNVANGT